MPILEEHVASYLQALRPERSPLMVEMESLAEREGIPIVHWETGRFLATLVRATDPALVLEVGTAIGYSTLHMAEALGRGKIVTIERDHRRVLEARDFLERAGVADRVEIIEGDAMECLERLDARAGLRGRAGQSPAAWPDRHESAFWALQCCSAQTQPCVRNPLSPG